MWVWQFMMVTCITTTHFPRVRVYKKEEKILVVTHGTHSYSIYSLSSVIIWAVRCILNGGYNDIFYKTKKKTKQIS